MSLPSKSFYLDPPDETENSKEPIPKNSSDSIEETIDGNTDRLLINWHFILEVMKDSKNRTPADIFPSLGDFNLLAI